MISQLKKTINRNFSNLPGWRTNRKIVVFESDDWGSIRMPSQKSFDFLKGKGVDVSSGDALRYNLNDTLATAHDLSTLFDVLNSVKDKNNNPAVFTPVSLVANPDFEKIKESGFGEYFYEPFTVTLQRYNREDAFQLWQEGVQKRLFIPQFHGREHLNVQVWLRALQNNDKHTLLAFDQGMWGFKNKLPHQINYQAAFNLELPEDIVYQKSVIEEGLKLFEQLHGYNASFFVPPNGPFNEKLEQTAGANGIRFMSTSKIHYEPQGNGQFKRNFHWLGQINKYNQRYITRNAFFEPSQPGKDWIISCLKDISIAFRWHKPAVVSSHRVNYIGALRPENRDNGIKQLKFLLKEIKKRWPDVEFMNSSQLGELICS
jgi:hypothetical protein